MADLPVLRSKEQILGELITGFLARVPDVNDFSRGSVILQFFSAVAQQNFKAAADVIAMIDALSVDRATGEALQRLAADADVTISSGTFASTRVDITDVSFTKISSSVYAGQPAPVAGSLNIYVNDASKMPATGSIYIGRGTPNVEGPLVYTSVSQQSGGAYWLISLSPSSPTTKFHNIGETVILSQGGKRTIASGSLVNTPGSSSVTSVSFKTTATVSIPDGDVTALDVPVSCVELGTKGNVPRGAIRETSGLAFESVAFNPNAVTNGFPPDDDETIRSKIKIAEQIKSRGTEAAIKYAALGVTSPDDQNTVQSSAVVRYSNNSSTLVIDDGTGYQPIYGQTGIETVLSEALGGEQELQLRQYPVASVRLFSLAQAPFNLYENYSLTVEIEGTSTTHYFAAGDFRVPGKATSYEVISSINGDPNINFSANTADNGTRIVIFPKDNTKNEMRVIDTGTLNANTIMSFPTDIQYTLLLYKNDTLLYEDGSDATLYSRVKSSWSSSLSEGDTLTYQVDGTPEITVTLTQAVFQQFDITATVSSFTSITIWAEALNFLMTGVVVTVVGETLSFSSARGATSAASIAILGGTAKDKMFTIGAGLYAQGRQSDYTLNRQTGQIGLTDPLTAGQSMYAGSAQSRAHVSTNSIPDGPGAPGNYWLVVDGSAAILSSGIDGTTRVEWTRTGDTLTIEANTPGGDPTAFGDILPGDWFLAWTEPADQTNYPALYNFRGYWRVETAQVGRISVNVAGFTTPLSGGPINIPTDRFVVIRSLAPLQNLSFSVGTLSQFAAEINAGLSGVTAQVVGSTVRLNTQTAGPEGELAFVAADSPGKALGIIPPIIVQNIPSQRGFVANYYTQYSMPSFTWGTLPTVTSGISYVQPDFTDLGGNLSMWLSPLNSTVIDTSEYMHSSIGDYDPNTSLVTLSPPTYMADGNSPVQTGDRYYYQNSYALSDTDTSVVVIDGDEVTKTYTLPVARGITVNGDATPTLLSFSADDAESTLTLDDPASFYDYSFNGWKIWRQSKTILTDSVYSLTVSANDYGPSGNSQRVGIFYPSDVSSTSLVLAYKTSSMTDIAIYLPVTTARTTTIDGTTSWTTQVTALPGASDQVVYTYRVGTAPNLLTSFVQTGDVAILNPSLDFLSGNKGFQAKLQNVTATSFTVVVPSGSAVSDNVQFSQSQNVHRTLVVTTATPHNIVQGQRLGIWNTAISSGITQPINGSYYPTVINASQFSVSLPTSVPGGTVASASLTNNVVTATTSAPHGLVAGNIVVISDFSTATYNGLATIQTVPTPTQFTYLRNGTSPSVVGGWFDFQTYGTGTSVSNVSINRSGSLVTVVSSAAHGLVIGQPVSILGSAIDSWDNSISYVAGSIVSYSGNNYRALIATTIGNAPNLYPLQWIVTTQSFNNTYTVNTTPTPTSFTFFYELATGTQDSTVTPGSSAGLTSLGSLARSVGSSGALLNFVEAQSTSQEIIDALAQSYSSILGASVTTGFLGTDIVATSTLDTQLSGGFLSGNVTSRKTVSGSQKVYWVVSANVPAGSQITFSGLGAYNGTYEVLASEQLTLSTWQITVQSSVTAIVSATSVVAGTFTGYSAYLALSDGENYVAQTDLAAISPNPQFTLQYAYNLLPVIGETFKLVAYNNVQLQSFYNKLVVSGISNVAEVSFADYSQNLQMMTNTFGSVGSIQVAGGTANQKTVALVGSGSELDNKIGVINIPYDLRHGFDKNGWVQLGQTVLQNKQLGFNGSTQLRIQAVTNLQLVGGSGTFQTARAITSDETTVFQLQKQGSFTALIRLSGQAVNFGTAGVQEGDWVRLKNAAALAWGASGTYVAGDRVFFSGFNFTAISGSTPLTSVKPIPDTVWEFADLYLVGQTVTFKSKAYRLGGLAPSQGDYPDDLGSPWVLVWEIQEWNGGNTGIHQVVRVFGEDTIYLDGTNFIEQIVTLGDASNINIYSYDSIMPGDVLVLSGPILGTLNIGRYTVQDEAYNPSYSFPSPTQIYVTPFNTTHATVTLADFYPQVNIEQLSTTKAYKKILAAGPSSATTQSLVFDTPNLTSRFTSSNGAYVTAIGKLGFNTQAAFGIDAYKNYEGLVKAVNKVIYGDPTNPSQYPGVRAAGTSIDISPPLIRRITLSLAVRLKTGIPFSSVRENIKAAAAGFVNSLGVGESVPLSKVIESVSKVQGVTSVVITFPTYTSSADRIAVANNEKALVLDPTNDITVSVLS